MASAYMPLYANIYASVMPGSGMQMCINPGTCQLKVEGIGRVEVPPDEAVVILSVITENMELSQAQEENTKRMTSVLSSLNENGIPPEDIQTQSYNIIPQYDYIEGKQVFRGYRVEHSIEVTIKDMGSIGKVIDDAVRNGVNQVGSIKFSIANPSPFYQQALNSAVDDALEKARTLGRKLNIALSRVPVRIIELGYQTGVPTPLTYQAAATATPIQTGRIEISARIEAIFVYRPLY